MKLRVWRAQKCDLLVNAKTASTGTGQQITPCHVASAMKIFRILGLLFAMVPSMHQCKVYFKRKVRVWRAQKCNFLASAKSAPIVTGQQTTRVLQRHIGQAIESFKISGLPIDMVPCLYQCNVYIVRKLRVWRAQKCNFLVSAKTTRPFWVNKLPRVMQCHIGPAIEIFGISGLPFAMVPGLHQCNVCIKTKLRVWRAQKCNFLVSAKTKPTGTVLQTIPCHSAPYRASNGNFRNFGATYRHGTVFAPMQCLY